MGGETLRGLHTKELGRRAVYLPEVDSTNRYLKDNGVGFPHGTLCYTGRQTAGRGRLGRSWTAPDGQALAMSILFRPNGGAAACGLRQLPLLCGLAVAEAVEDMSGASCAIKWPNDSICGGRKVCGILCESRVMTDDFFAVAGMGVNLTQTAEEFEAQGLANAGSLSMLTGKAVSVGEMAAAVLNRLEPLWEVYYAEGFSPLRGAYEARCLTIGKAIRALSPDGELRLEGTAVGLDTEGRLLVDTPAGRQALDAGEVSIRSMNGYS